MGNNADGKKVATFILLTSNESKINQSYTLVLWYLHTHTLSEFYCILVLI